MDEKNTYYINGYPSLAAFIASDPDRTTLIFRRFDRLAARNLLQLQGELARLERLLDQDDGKDVTADRNTQQYLRNWDDFRDAAENHEEQRRRLELHKQIQTTMKDYSNLPVAVN
jgi:hypothetical protein